MPTSAATAPRFRTSPTGPHAGLRDRTRTGGPKDDGPKILEHVLGWTFVVVLAMFLTQTGLM